MLVNIESDTEYKLCKKCNHCINWWGYTLFNYWQLSRCNRYNSRQIITPKRLDVVSGKKFKEVKLPLPYCDSERDGCCGEKATYFEPRKNLWQKFLKIITSPHKVKKGK